MQKMRFSERFFPQLFMDGKKPSMMRWNMFISTPVLLYILYRSVELKFVEGVIASSFLLAVAILGKIGQAMIENVAGKIIDKVD